MAQFKKTCHLLCTWSSPNRVENKIYLKPPASSFWRCVIIIPIPGVEFIIPLYYPKQRVFFHCSGVFPSRPWYKTTRVLPSPPSPPFLQPFLRRHQHHWRPHRPPTSGRAAGHRENDRTSYGELRLRFQWSFLVPLIGGRWYIFTQLAVYTTYIPLIYCLLGDYISPTTY